MPFDSKLIQSLVDDLENDRSEHTRSVNDTDKFGQAVCAFANDLPGSGKPGYLIIGADDKTGHVLDIPITDQLLKNLSAIRTDGNIQSQPSERGT